MQVDIVKTGGKWAVYPRSAFMYEEYKGDPIFTDEDEGECWNWCDEHHYDYRRRRNAMLVEPKFVKDVERRADEAVRRIYDAGLRVESDVTYRASAAWKENPTHYAYIGDFGGCAKLTWSEGSNVTADKWDVGLGILRELFGMSTALWELGFTLTFDKDGKHTVFGKFPEWVTLDEED